MSRAAKVKPINMNDEVMYVEDAAKFYHIEKDALYKRIRRGRVPFHKSGRKYIFLKSELIAGIQN